MPNYKTYKDYGPLNLAVTQGFLDSSEATFLFKHFNPNVHESAQQLNIILKNDGPRIKRWIDGARIAEYDPEKVAIFAETRINTLRRINSAAAQKKLQPDELRYLESVFTEKKDRLGGLLYLLENRSADELRQTIIKLKSGTTKLEGFAKNMSNKNTKQMKKRRNL